LGKGRKNREKGKVEQEADRDVERTMKKKERKNEEGEMVVGWGWEESTKQLQITGKGGANTDWYNTPRQLQGEKGK